MESAKSAIPRTVHERMQVLLLRLLLHICQVLPIVAKTAKFGHDLALKFGKLQYHPPVDPRSESKKNTTLRTGGRFGMKHSGRAAAIIRGTVPVCPHRHPSPRADRGFGAGGWQAPTHFGVCKQTTNALTVQSPGTQQSAFLGLASPSELTLAVSCPSGRGGRRRGKGGIGPLET